MTQQTQKLRLNALIALVVGSMIGGGIFSLPQNIAERAAGGAVLIGWAITAVPRTTPSGALAKSRATSSTPAGPCRVNRSVCAFISLLTP